MGAAVTAKAHIHKHHEHSHAHAHKHDHTHDHDHGHKHDHTHDHKHDHHHDHNCKSCHHHEAEAKKTDTASLDAERCKKDMHECKDADCKIEAPHGHIHHKHEHAQKQWNGLSALIEKTKLHPQIKKALYLLTSIASATPFGEALAHLQVDNAGAQMASPVAGVSLMQALMHGKDRIGKYLLTLPVVLLSGLGRVAGLPTFLRRVLTVGALQVIEGMQDPKLHKHGDHYHGDTQPRLKYIVDRFKDPKMRSHLLTNLGRLELTINTAIPLAGFVREKVASPDQGLAKRTASWILWLATLTAGIMGLDSGVGALLKAMSSEEKKDDQTLATESGLSCGHCGGMHVEASCPIALSEETAIAAG